MSSVIKRGITEVSQEIKGLNAELKKSNSEIKQLDKAIKIDSGNVDAVRSRFAMLGQQLEANTKKVSALKNKQQQLEYALDSGAITEKKYQKEIISTNEALKLAEKSTATLTAELKRQNQAIAAAKFDRINKGLETFQNKAQGAARAAKVMLGALAAITVAFIKLGDELADTATKMRVTVEDLQIGRGLYENFAEGASGYDSALKALGSTMSSIAKGRGAAYIETLKAIGIASNDLIGVDTATQLDIISNALRNIPDEAKRVEYAMILMGDAGRNVATVANLAAEDVNTYKKALIEAGIVTTEQAAVADELANKTALLKQQFTAQAATLVTAMLPAINAVMGAMQAITPILSTIGAGFDFLGKTGSVVLIMLIGFVAVLPKLIGMIKAIVAVIKILRIATIAQAAATGVLSAAAGPLIIAFVAIAAVILLIIGLFRRLKKSQDEASDSLSGYKTELKDLQSSAEFTGAAVDQNTASTAATSALSAGSTTTNNYNNTAGPTSVAVNVYVTEPGASAEDIAETVSRAVALRLAAAR